MSSYARPSATLCLLPFGPVARIIGHWLSLIGQKVGTLTILRTRGRPAGVFLGTYQTSTHMCVLMWKSPFRCMSLAPCWRSYKYWTVCSLGTICLGFSSSCLGKGIISQLPSNKLRGPTLQLSLLSSPEELSCHLHDHLQVEHTFRYQRKPRSLSIR